MPKFDRSTVKKGMFLTGGPDPSTVVKTRKLEPSVEEVDQQFDEAASLHASLVRIQKAIEDLKAKPKP